MNFSDWLKLTEDERESMCQQLNPYEEWDIFKAVESEFISRFDNQQGVGKVFCGLAPGLGPYNAIMIDILPNCRKTKFPKKFLGFPIMRFYHRK
jgi:hypothetical protein